MNNITRDDIADYLNQEFGLSKQDCNNIVNDLIEEIIRGLLLSRKIKIHNFGTFVVKTKKERIGRNPKTKEVVMIKSRNVVSFTPSKKIMVFLNKNFDDQ
tara:strand:- start:100 stop:399 length:300 start_codon:yes stop_codon:yes gene_type:complete